MDLPGWARTPVATMLHPRLAACLAAIACLGWYTSSYRSLLGNEYPNSVYACYKDAQHGVGFVSINGASCLFVERDPELADRRVWDERPDGYFCAFRLPTGGTTGWEVNGLAVRVNAFEVAWCCPYWLMALFWGGVAVSKGRRLTTADWLGITTCIAVYFALSVSRVVLPLLGLLNLVTLMAMLCVLLTVGWCGAGPAFRLLRPTV